MTDREHYLVWSNEHKAWWRAGHAGYTYHLSQAGRYTRAEALSICSHAIPGTAGRLYALPELPVRLSDAFEMQRRFRANYPDAPIEGWE